MVLLGIGAIVVGFVVGLLVFVLLALLVWRWSFRDRQKPDDELGGFSNLLLHPLFPVHLLPSLLLLDTNYA